MLRAAFWNALVLVRGPLQILLKVVMLIHLVGGIAGVVVIFTGTGIPNLDDAPMVFRILAPLYMFGVYVLASWISVKIDSLIYGSTPEGRRVFLRF